MQSLDREQIINRVRKEMKKEDRFVTAKQVCAILSTAQVMPSSCFCTYCWQAIDVSCKPAYEKRNRGEIALANRIFLPCQHMVCCVDCAATVQRKFHKCAFCQLSIEEITAWDDRRQWEKKYPGITHRKDYEARWVKREFSKCKSDADDSGVLDRAQAEELITRMLGLKTTAEAIAQALDDMDANNSGEIDYNNFAAWWKREHLDEHPAGADCFNIKSQIDEMVGLGGLVPTEALKHEHQQFAGDRQLGVELVVLLWGRTVDLLQFKKVINFFSNEERVAIYSRIGPLNALNPMDPDAKWSLQLGGEAQGYIKDDNVVAEMLVKLAVGEPGENWSDAQFRQR